MVRAIHILPYLSRLRGLYLSDSGRAGSLGTFSDNSSLNALKQFTKGPLRPLIAETPHDRDVSIPKIHLQRDSGVRLIIIAYFLGKGKINLTEGKADLRAPLSTFDFGEGFR